MEDIPDLDSASNPENQFNRDVAKGPNFPKNKGKLGILGPPRPNNNMRTPCPYSNFIGTKAEGRGPPFCHCIRI